MLLYTITVLNQQIHVLTEHDVLFFRFSDLKNALQLPKKYTLCRATRSFPEKDKETIKVVHGEHDYISMALLIHLLKSVDEAGDFLNFFVSFFFEKSIDAKEEEKLLLAKQKEEEKITQEMSANDDFKSLTDNFFVPNVLFDKKEKKIEKEIEEKMKMKKKLLLKTMSQQRNQPKIKKKLKKKEKKLKNLKVQRPKSSEFLKE